MNVLKYEWNVKKYCFIIKKFKNNLNHFQYFKVKIFYGSSSFSIDKIIFNSIPVGFYGDIDTKQRRAIFQKLGYSTRKGNVQKVL
jgi:hypothetical protein